MTEQPNSKDDSQNETSTLKDKFVRLVLDALKLVAMYVLFLAWMCVLLWLIAIAMSCEP